MVQLLRRFFSPKVSAPRQKIEWTTEDSIAASKQGWCVFKSVDVQEVGGKNTEYLLCGEDGMGVFAGDYEAALFVKAKATEGDTLAQKAVAYLQQEGSSDIERFALHQIAVTARAMA